jgi:hypothetical protein
MYCDFLDLFFLLMSFFLLRQRFLLIYFVADYFLQIVIFLESCYLASMQQVPF